MIIGLVGHAKVGKDTVAKIIKKYLYDCSLMSFSTPIKTMIYDLLEGIYTPSELEGNKEADLHRLKIDPPVSYRLLMQTLGDWGRSLDKDFWVKLLKNRLYQNKNSNIIITDVRFVNEAAMVKGMGGKLIRIIRTAPSVRPHSSEVEHVLIDVDYTIENEGTLEELELKVITVLKDIFPFLYGYFDRVEKMKKEQLSRQLST